MNKRLLLLYIFIIIPSLLSAQKVLTRSGEYTFISPSNISLDQARFQAIERAKIQIIEDAFGSNITKTVATKITTNNASSNTEMLILGNNEISGEWLETIGEPIIKEEYNQGTIIIKVHITGKIRKFSGAQIDLNAKILRNGVEEKFESSDFKENDDIYLLFKSPVKGYITVYLYDGEEVYCLLPYDTQEIPEIKVKANTEYIFFSAEHANYNVKSTDIKDYQLTCSGDLELNRIYIIFSPNSYIKALDNKKQEFDDIRSLSFNDFQKWLSKVRTRDTQMQVEIRDITVRKQ